MVDYRDRMSAVFFTSGCNFRCGFCHNANLMGQLRPGLSWEKLESACKTFKAEWVDAVSISGGEPTLAPDLVDLIHFFKAFGFLIKLDTNGSRPEVLKHVLPMVDYVAMDVKSALSEYSEFVCFKSHEAIQQSIELIMEHARDYEFRTTLIESYHDDEQIRSIGETVKGAKRFVVQPFLPKEDLPNPAFSLEKRTTPCALNKAGKTLSPYIDEVIVRGAGKTSQTY